jgi:hypothetical protein
VGAPSSLLLLLLWRRAVGSRTAARASSAWIGADGLRDGVGADERHDGVGWHRGREILSDSGAMGRNSEGRDKSTRVRVGWESNRSNIQSCN